MGGAGVWGGCLGLMGAKKLGGPRGTQLWSPPMPQAGCGQAELGPGPLACPGGGKSELASKGPRSLAC